MGSEFEKNIWQVSVKLLPLLLHQMDANVEDANATDVT